MNKRGKYLNQISAIQPMAKLTRNVLKNNKIIVALNFRHVWPFPGEKDKLLNIDALSCLIIFVLKLTFVLIPFPVMEGSTLFGDSEKVNK